MVIILKRNIQKNFDLIQNRIEYNLSDDALKTAYIDFLAYIRLYVKTEGKDTFIKSIVSNTEFEDYVKNIK